MPKKQYWANALTGGGVGALDTIDGTDLADLDMAYVVTATLFYTYSLDADSAASESSPDVISPDTNAGDKRWILTGLGVANVTLNNTGLHILDTNASHDLIIKPGSDLSADRTLTLTTGDADKTLTLSGNATLDDWFDQAVKEASSPTFAGLTLAGNLALAANSITGTSVDISNAELQQLSNIGAATISSTQWGYLGSSTAAGGAVLDAATDAAILALLSGDAAAAFDWNNQNLTGLNRLTSASGTLFIDEIASLSDYTANADTDVSGCGWVIDEDNMVSDLDTKVPTQQSVKAYVDAQTHDGDTLQLDGINSDGGAFSFNTTGAVTFNQNLIIPDAGNIGSSSDTDAIAISAAGILSFSGQSGCSVYLSADQDIAADSDVLVEFDTEDYDIQSEFNTGTYTFTIGTAGKYQVSGIATTAENIGTDKNFWCSIYKNNAFFARGSRVTIGIFSNPVSVISLTMDLAATDTIDLRVKHNHTENREIDADYCKLTIQKVG